MKPYKKWYLKVSEFHEIYYECIWNKKNTPILFVHWWPWGWFKSKHRKIFDLEKDNIIFFDQRWAWKSKVIWDDILKENTTDFLVEDINKLLDFLSIKKVTLFWRSWGSTLTLIYAIRNPEKIESMILWWIYLWWMQIEDDFLFWNWNENYFPEFWEELLNNFPKEIQNDRKKMKNYIWEEYKNWNNKPLLALNKYEWDVMSIDQNKKEKKEDKNKDKDKKDININFALIEFYYLYNACFIEKDYILNNCEKIENIKTYIIQWRYDSVCPASWAYELHKKLKNSKLILTIAGHSSSDKKNKKATKEVLKEVRK